MSPTMVSLTLHVEITQDEHYHLKLLLRALAHTPSTECTHGTIGSIDQLVRLLLEDCASTIRRPGSWEGANMISVLQAHGYL